MKCQVKKYSGLKSLSARRAWIEMLGWLRVLEVTRSLSARRAWIEILLLAVGVMLAGSLSARRAWIEILCLRLMFWPFTGRSPQGERG